MATEERWLMKVSVQYYPSGPFEYDIVTVFISAKDVQDAASQLKKKDPKYGEIVFAVVIQKEA